MSDRSGHWRRRRPPWWPREEAWPPAPDAWRAVHGRFLRRVGFLLFLLFTFWAGALVLGFIFGWSHGPSDHWHDGWGWRGPPLIGFFLLFLAAVFVIRRLRRLAAPVGELMEATG